MDKLDFAQSSIISPREFTELGTLVLERLRDSMEAVAEAPLTCHVLPEPVMKHFLEAVPENGSAPQAVIGQALDLMLGNSLFVRHPRFLGYVCPAGDPMGALADLIVAAVNPNAASAMMTPVGHEMEKTVIRWLAEMLGLPGDSDGILVSGGNEANLLGLLVARQFKTPWPIREAGFDHPDARPLRIYATEEIHNGVIKAAEIIGLGRSGVRVVPTDPQKRMDVAALRSMIAADKAKGDLPFCVVPSAGTIAQGVTDPIRAILDVARKEDLWVHVDGSYGVSAAILPDALPDLKAVAEVDSVGWDPHKWLRVPYESGCILVRHADALRETFGTRPSYYLFDGHYDGVTHYYEKGPQNSRNLRALKVWASLKQHGRRGHAAMIAHDIELAKKFAALVGQTPQLELWSCHLCVVTFRYIPLFNKKFSSSDELREALNAVNSKLLSLMQAGGDSYLSNAVIDGNYLLRACFVNFMTSEPDLRRVIDLTLELGHQAEGAC